MWLESYTPLEIKKLNFAARASSVIKVRVAESGNELMANRPVVGALCFSLLLSGSAWAATVEPGEGALSINQGQGFQPINSRVDANVGDSVMVSPGGSATVVYDDGCKVSVQPGSVATIAPLSPCATGSYAQDQDNGDTWGAIGMLVVTGGVAGLAIYQATKSSGNTSPASP